MNEVVVEVAREWTGIVAGLAGSWPTPRQAHSWSSAGRARPVRGRASGQAALAAHGRKVLVVDDGELADDLVADMTEVLTSFCARLHGRRGARNRADKVLRCARADIGPASLGRDPGAPV